MLKSVVNLYGYGFSFEKTQTHAYSLHMVHSFSPAYVNTKIWPLEIRGDDPMLYGVGLDPPTTFWFLIFELCVVT